MNSEEMRNWATVVAASVALLANNYAVPRYRQLTRAQRERFWR